MKKSFMTRVLATGLSLAMAFSLSAATNVSVASAAAKPAMKSKTMTVKVGQKKNYQATAATQKAYKITKVKMSAAGKTKAKVTVNSSKKSIKVEGLAATKGSNVVISFKNNKTKKTTTVTTKVVVKEVATKQAIVKAEVTGAKTITLTMAKDVASVESPVAITVKKGTTVKEGKTSCSGTTITFVADTKFIAGDYSISIKGLEDEELTATANCAKNETLTTYEIGKELIPDADSSTTGYIYYKALNQYGEMMVANQPQPTCSFSTLSTGSTVDKVATASAEGKIKVTSINNALAILGQTGTCVLVDNATGVNATGEVTYSRAATAAKCTVEGMYNTAKSEMVDAITAKDDPDNIQLLLKFEDQYGHGLNTTALNPGTNVMFTVSGGITNLAAAASNAVRDVNISGVDYVAIQFAMAAGANPAQIQKGDCTITIVNNKYGLLLTHTISVVDYVLITSFSATPENGLYNGEWNTLSYSAVDSNGNTVTDYATLRNTVGFNKNATVVRWLKQDDGSAKLQYKPNITFPPVQNNNYSDTSTDVVIYSLNDNVSSAFKVLPVTYTVSRDRIYKSVYGLKDGNNLQVSLKRGATTLEYKDLYLVDQYSNKIKNDGKDNSGLSKITNVTTAAVTSPNWITVAIDTTGGIDVAVSTGGFTITPSAASATATIYLSLNSPANDSNPVASAAQHQAKIIINAVATEQVAPSTIKLENIFGGYQEKLSTTGSGSTLAVSDSAIKEKDINVSVLVGGVKTRIPNDQIRIDKVENGKFTKTELTNGVKTKEATVTFTVTTFDNNNIPTTTQLTGNYKISYADSYAYKVVDVSSAAIASTIDTASTGIAASYKKLNASQMQNFFTYKDQYGDDFDCAMATDADDVQKSLKYSILPVDTTHVLVYGTESNATYAIGDKYLSASGTPVKLDITVKSDDGSTVTAHEVSVTLYQNN